VKRFLDWLLAATAIGSVLALTFIFGERLKEEQGRYALLQNAHAEQAEMLTERGQELLDASTQLSRSREEIDLVSGQANRLLQQIVATNQQTAAMEQEIARLQPLRKVDKIVIHHTASSHGDVTDIDRWHRERGWSGIGYHYVITNGVSHSGQRCEDGEVEFGRPEDLVGAHAKGRNACTIGVSLVGNDAFSTRQVESLVCLLAHLCRRHNISADNVAWAIEPHHRDCPGFGCPLDAIRAKVVERIRSLYNREH